MFGILLDAFGQTDNINVISEYNAKISKGNINLQWQVINPQNVFLIKLSSKKTQESSFKIFTELDINTFTKKKFSDTLEIYSFSYKYKPTENGVYDIRVELTDITGKALNYSDLKIGFSEAKEFKLFQNKPNPFNPTTLISYELYTTTKVSLKVFNLSGKEIDVLVDDTQSPGTYEVEFNASKYGNFSSGIYFYKLQTNYSSDIRKMIYTK
jgi:hypothetical protein